MTLEAAHQLLVEIVSQQTSKYPNRRGVLGAVLGLELSARGHKGLHREFGFERMIDFLRTKCVPPLSLQPAPTGPDFLVSVAGSDIPGRALAPRETRAVEPRVWSAVLSGQGPRTFLSTEGEVAIGTPPTDDGWKQVPLMAQDRQAEILERAGRAILEQISSDGVRWSLQQVLTDARVANSPILEFSSTMSSLYRASVAWHRFRVQAVFDFVAETTGVDLRHSVTERVKAAPTSAVTTDDGEARVTRPIGPQEIDASDGLRQMIKSAIDVMSERELLALQLPVGAMYAAAESIRKR